MGGKINACKHCHNWCEAHKIYLQHMHAFIIKLRFLEDFIIIFFFCRHATFNTRANRNFSSNLNFYVQNTTQDRSWSRQGNGQTFDETLSTQWGTFRKCLICLLVPMERKNASTDFRTSTGYHDVKMKKKN